MSGLNIVNKWMSDYTFRNLLKDYKKINFYNCSIECDRTVPVSANVSFTDCTFSSSNDKEAEWFQYELFNLGKK